MIAFLLMILMMSSVFAGASNIKISQGNEKEKGDDSDVLSNMYDDVDQSQTHVDTYVSILYDPIKCWCAQSFKPSMNILTKVKLYMKKEGNPSKELIVTIRESLSGSDIVSVTKSAGQISTSPTWVEFNFEDVSVEKETTYYIVALTKGSGIYGWGIADSNKYSKGKAYHSFDGGGSWPEWQEPHDHTFKTYGSTATYDEDLEVSTNKINFGTFNYEKGGSRTKTFYVKNIGPSTSTLKWCLASSMGYISLEPDSGAIKGGEQQKVTITLSIPSFEMGSYDWIFSIINIQDFDDCEEIRYIFTISKEKSLIKNLLPSLTKIFYYLDALQN